MAKITVDFKIGKKLFQFDYSTQDVKEIDKNKHLTKKQKTRLKDIIKQHLKETKTHFNDAAYKLDADFIIREIIDDFFGVNFSDIVIAEFCTKANVACEWKNKTYFVNDKTKAFYNPIKNKIYLDTRARNLEHDVQLGDV
jgi:hypothetical protein